MTDLSMKPGAIIDSSRLWRALVLCMLLLVTALMLRNVASLLMFAGTSLSYPYSFDYGEGIVWQQMRDMLQGTAYGPLGVFPALVYHYPPVFHLTAAAAAGVAGADQLAAGRAVEVISTFASAALLAILTMQALGQEASRTIRIACGACAALFFLNCLPVITWAPLMRVDMLSGALALLGLVVTIRAVSRPGWIHAAAIAFVLSLYTKQISVAAPMAAFGVMLLVDWWTALRGIGTATVLGLVVLGTLCWMTDGGFARHIFLYNVNRLDLTRIWMLVDGIVDAVPLLVLAAFGLAAGWRGMHGPAAAGFNEWTRRLRNDPAAFAVAVLTVFLILKTLMLSAILKSGSNNNYFIEWLAAVVVLAGIAMRPPLTLAAGGVAPTQKAPLLVVLAAIVVLTQNVATMPMWSMNRQLLDRQAVLATVIPKIAAASKPVIADDMTLPIRAGKSVEWEPAIFAELGASGVYDEAAFVRMVRDGAFAFFVTAGRPGDTWFDQHFNPAVQAAIKEAYPVQQDLGEYVLHLPR
jgi:hypothetical protein